MFDVESGGIGSPNGDVVAGQCDRLPNAMAKIKLHGMFARVMGKFNRSETLYFKRCNCGREQLGVDLLNPSKARGAKNVECQNALKTAAQAAKAALADPTQRATLETAFKAQSRYTSLFAYTVAQKYVKPDFD